MDNEKIVRDLINTFNDRDELHIAYKKRMKSILVSFFCEITSYFEDKKDEEITHKMVVDFIDTYIEERFIPEK